MKGNEVIVLVNIVNCWSAGGVQRYVQVKARYTNTLFKLMNGQTVTIYGDLYATFALYVSTRCITDLSLAVRNVFITSFLIESSFKF